MPILLALRRLGQEDCEFKASYIVRSCIKRQKQKSQTYTETEALLERQREGGKGMRWGTWSNGLW